MATKKNISTAEVRAWAKENLSSIDEAGHLSILGKNGDGSMVRGRLHPVVREAFNKAHSKNGKVYAEKAAEAKTVTRPVTGKDKAGRKRTIQRTLTTSYVRTLLGQVDNDGKSQKGRFNESDLLAAFQADYDREVAAAA